MISDDLGSFMNNGHANHGEAPAAIYAQLRRLAASYLRQERRGHTLQPTALVNEAVLRLLSSGEAEGVSTGALMQTAARAMRHVLIDHARRHQAGKRGGWLEGGREALREDQLLMLPRDVDLLALEEALERLGEMDAELLRIVELRFFGGLTEEQAAACLGVSSRTVTRGWRFAKVWLARELSGDAA